MCHTNFGSGSTDAEKNEYPFPGGDTNEKRLAEVQFLLNRHSLFSLEASNRWTKLQGTVNSLLVVKLIV